MNFRLALLALVISLLSVSSQACAGPATFGIKGGVTLASMNQDPAYRSVVDLQDRTAWNGGAFVLYPLGSAFSLQGDILYVSRGASLGKSEIRDETGNNLGSFETFLKRDDLDVGLRARFAFAQGARFQPYLLAGPGVSIELDEKMTTDPDFGSQPSHLLKSTGIGVTFGAGTEIPVGPGHWLLEANYDLGITDLAEDSVNGTLHASTWRFMTGYHF